MPKKYLIFIASMTILSTIISCEKPTTVEDLPSKDSIIAASPTPPVNNIQSESQPPPPEPDALPTPKPSLPVSSSTVDLELIEAVKNGNVEQVKELLENGADPNSFYQLSDETFNTYKSVLGIAVDKKNVGIARLLLNNNADVNKDSFYAQKTSLSSSSNFEVAVYNEDLKMMQLLVDHNAYLIKKDNTPPIIIGVKNVEVLDFLMKHGFDINARNIEGRTILIEAAFGNDVKLMKAILRYSPDLNLKTEEIRFTDFKKMTALQIAEYYGNKEIAQVLKNAGAK